MAKGLGFVLLSVIAVYIGVCGVLYTMQRNLLYYPTPKVERDDAEAIYLYNDLSRIKVWKAGAENRHAIIYFGGNAEQVALNIPSFQQHLPGYDFYLMNYRGYGGSTGAPSETALYVDALSLYDLVNANYETVSLIGRSLGSGVATYVAANRSVDTLALITPYDSIERVAQSKFPFIPVSYLLHDKYDSAGRAHDITATTLIVAAESDGVIPLQFTESLANSFQPPQPTISIVPGTQHLTVSSTPEFWETLGGFFRLDKV